MTQTVYEPLQDELARTLTAHRGGKKAGQIAWEILDQDNQLRTVVGLDANAERAIIYEYSRYQLLGVPIEDDGLGSRAGSFMEQLEGWGAFQAWLAEQDPDEFAWVHPRYRWLFDNQCGGLC